ncbi:alpha/beta fold hydrolase [Frankia gtarii]|uniref:alpha/beta fold hydrolase n=1 Tax=Frankia gtarii TaxID=2950102 RepID=UPI0034D7A413
MRRELGDRPAQAPDRPSWPSACRWPAPCCTGRPWGHCCPACWHRWPPRSHRAAWSPSPGRCTGPRGTPPTRRWIRDAVERDLVMFLDFEPPPLPVRICPTIIMVGADSPPARHRAARLLREKPGLTVQVVPGCGHAAHLEAPAAFAQLLEGVHLSPRARSAPGSRGKSCSDHGLRVPGTDAPK